jgi:hypothetical protein
VSQLNQLNKYIDPTTCAQLNHLNKDKAPTTCVSVTFLLRLLLRLSIYIESDLCLPKGDLSVVLGSLLGIALALGLWLLFFVDFRGAENTGSLTS